MSKLALAIQLFLVSSMFSAEVLEDTIEKVVPLQADGTFTLHSIDGSVEIYGAQDNEAKIIAIRKAFSPERLNQIQIQVSGDRNALTINTVAPAPPRRSFRDRSGTIDYIINLPQNARVASVSLPNGELIIHGMRGAGIAASLGNGRLTSHNCYCDQTLRVQNGGLDLFFDWEEDRPITVEGKIVNGNARAIIPGDASFELHATSLHGRVRSDFTEMKDRKREGASAINEIIGAAPLSKLTLSAVEGNIQILEALF